MDITSQLDRKISFLKQHWANTLGGHLGFNYKTLDLERIEAVMPVDERTMQPFGLLHGGASVALAESIASIGAWLNVDDTKFHVVGLEINANHIRPVTSGEVRGVGTPIHRGRRTQVWSVELFDKNDRLVCTSRCTVAVIDAAANSK